MASPADVQVRVGRVADHLTPEIREAILRRAGQHLVGIIKRRTAQGVDADGEAFRSYSKRYAKLKAASGRNTRPDLTLSGAMLNGLTVLDVTPERALVGFTGSSTAYRFKRMRTKKGAKTSKKLPRGGRATHVLSRNASAKPVANAVKAKAHNEGQGVPRRHFFAVSAEEKQQIIAEAARTLRLKR